jgi:integrase
MSAPAPLDATGRRRSPATLPGYHAGRAPRNKGLSYPADPPRVEEIIAVMRQAGENVQGDRARGLIVVLWRTGLRIHEALALTELDLDQGRGALLVRHGKGDKRREVGMDDWGLGPPTELAIPPRPAAGRAAVLRHRGTDTRTALEPECRPCPTQAARRPGRCPPTLRPAPAAPCARHRNGTRRCRAQRHPTPAGSHRPRRHLDLPPRHRQRRDHQHSAPTTSTDDARQRRPTALTNQG